MFTYKLSDNGKEMTIYKDGVPVYKAAAVRTDKYPSVSDQFAYHASRLKGSLLSH